MFTLRIKLALVALLIFLSGLGVVISPALTYAQVDPLSAACQGEAENAAACKATADNPIYGPTGVVTRATQIVIIVAGAAAVISLVISGFRYVTSGGDPQKTNVAKNAILYSVIGLVVALIAQAIVSFVLRRL